MSTHLEHHPRWHTPIPRPTPTDSIRDRVCPRQSSDGWRGLSGQSAGDCGLRATVDQLDAIGVDDSEHRRGGQEDLRPVLMRPEEAKEPGALGEARKQRAIITRQPAIERPVVHPFEGMQQPQGDHLTGPEVRLRMFGDGAHLLIDLVEQCRDKIEGDHGLLRSWQGVTISTSVEEGPDHDNKTSKNYRVLLVCQRLTPLVI